MSLGDRIAVLVIQSQRLKILGEHAYDHLFHTKADDSNFCLAKRNNSIFEFEIL